MVFGSKGKLFLIAGPCVIEDPVKTIRLAGELAEIAKEHSIPLIFKASYDKANRTSIDSFRGPGLEEGLKVLARIKAMFNLPILTDVHQVSEVKPVAEVADILQLPAFLCRQTDLCVALGETGKTINIKKGQFLAPWDIKNVIEKIERTGNKNIILTERGTCFGYNNLVVDMRSLIVMRQFGYPVVFDATHSVQIPGGHGNGTAGDSRYVPYLSRAAVACGCDGLFWEVHPNPKFAKSDKDNAIPLSSVPATWRICSKINDLVAKSQA